MGVDNILTKPCDPLLIGMMKGIDGKNPLDMVSKYVDSFPGEKTGRIVL
jgi:UDP-N-acetylglucosamine pyrophosphorylase